MKATVWVNKMLSVEVEGDDNKAVFRGIADAQALFEDSTCGNCQSDDIKFQVRSVEDNDFYEVVCKKCGHKLSYGHSKANNKMYPKRMEVDKKGKAVRGEDGKPKYLPAKGWIKWDAVKDNDKE